MKFGNRFSARSEKLLAQRNERYRQHLLAQAFPTNDPSALYFGADVFHDSPVCVKSVDVITNTVVIQLRNVYAVDRIVERLLQVGAKLPATKELRRKCSTLVRFRGVKQFQVKFADLGSGAEYHSSEIWKTSEHYAIDIYVHANGGFGRIHLQYGAVEVEDILPHLAKYVRRGIATSELTTPIPVGEERGND